METPVLAEVQTQSATSELAAFMSAAKNPVPSMPVSQEPVITPIVPVVPIVEAPPVIQAEPAQPTATTPTPAAAIPVPDKFKNPDGTPNSDRIAKSTADVEAALQKYLAKEKELRQAQNGQRAPQVIPQAQPQAQQLSQDPFHQKIEADIKQFGIAPVLAELFSAAQKAAHAAAVQDIQEIRQETQDTKRRRELEALATHDEWLISPQGVETLGNILQAKPWLMNAPKPWEEAYKSYIAEQQMSQRLAGKVQTPIPTAQAVSAPATPVSAAPRVPAGPPVLRSKEDINRYVDSLTPEDQKKFYASRGLTLK